MLNQRSRAYRLAALILLAALCGACALPAWADAQQVLGARAYITGTVTIGGRPAAGVTLQAAGERGYTTALTAPNGHYALGVSAGAWKVTAMKEGYRNSVKENLTVADLASLDNQDFALEPSRATLSGHTYTPDHQPVTRAMVLCGGGFAMSNGRGEYTLSLDEGTYEVTAMKQTYEQQNVPTITIAAGQHLTQDLTLAPNTATISGVIQTVEGRPLDQAIAMAIANDKAEGEGGADPGQRGGSMPAMSNATKIDGLFLVRVRGGTYMLMPTRRDYMPAMSQMQEGGVTVTVPPGGHVDGVVLLMQPGSFPGAPPPPEQVEPNVLVAAASFTPNVVLHWTRTVNPGEERTVAVFRSAKAFTAPGPGVLRLEDPEGGPAEHLNSFTDRRAKPGATYFYAVAEIKDKGAVGPLSNVVQVTAR